MSDAKSNFREAIRDAGLKPPEAVEPGKFQRFPGHGKPASNRAGWCKLFEDEEGGQFGDWSTGLNETWQARKPASEAERKRWTAEISKAREQAERERRSAQDEAAKECAEAWRKAQPAPTDHPYLVAKGIEPHGIRIESDRLLVPIRNAAGEIRSLQRIDAQGSKRFHPGGEIAGNYYAIGKPDGLVIVAEGFATAASIHQATGYAVAVALNAGNLKPVAEAIRAKLSEARIIIAADDDRNTEGNPGIAKATEAAREVGGIVAEPGRAGDFNDLHAAERLEAVKMKFSQVAQPERMTRPLSEIKPEPIRWLWPNRIARGKLTLIAGDPKLGKSLLTADITARITAGQPWPVDGSYPPRGAVIFASAEDDAADTIRPRLEAAQADISRVHILETVQEADPESLEVRERMFNLKRDMARLDSELVALSDVVAVIIDPVTAYLGGTDSHKNSDIRELLAPLAKLAGKHDVAVIAVSHLNKGGSNNALYRVSGSLAFTATARACWLVAKDQDDEDRRLLLPSGSNIAPDIGGLAYRIVTNDTRVGPVAVLDWDPDPVDVDASDALQPDSDERDEKNEAVDWLQDMLAHGPMKAAEIKKAANKEGLAWRTVQRARRQAGVESVRSGFGQGSRWRIRVSEPPPQKDGANGANAKNSGFQGYPESHLRHSRQPTDTSANGTDGSRADLFRMAKDACDGLHVDPSELVEFIAKQNDPELYSPAAVRRWAEVIEERGFPRD
ncbi:AAA family ATPase [Wenzhouxiangella sp. EGI_FJ10305]|uniref:AAA family ATPase n=1 Tax=Wenzhouxiangella sp. EGI_FJ10305 TaxID=3243768 RepID=UPI0035D66A19